MEEKRDRDAETAEEKTAEETPVSESETEKNQQEKPTANFGLLLLAGAYLVYTGYKLCKGVLSGDEDAGIGFLAAGIAFAVIGAGMLISAAKNAMRRSRAKKAALEEEMKNNPELQPEEQKRMSISERARLAEHLSEEEAALEEEDAIEKEQE